MRILCGKLLKRLGANWICSCMIGAIVGDIAGSRFERNSGAESEWSAHGDDRRGL